MLNGPDTPVPTLINSILADPYTKRWIILDICQLENLKMDLITVFNLYPKLIIPNEQFIFNFNQFAVTVKKEAFASMYSPKVITFINAQRPN